jgi:hypothetical protein
MFAECGLEAHCRRRPPRPQADRAMRRSIAPHNHPTAPRLVGRKRSIETRPRAGFGESPEPGSGKPGNRVPRIPGRTPEPTIGQPTGQSTGHTAGQAPSRLPNGLDKGAGDPAIIRGCPPGHPGTPHGENRRSHCTRTEGSRQHARVVLAHRKAPGKQCPSCRPCPCPARAHPCGRRVLPQVPPSVAARRSARASLPGRSGQRGPLPWGKTPLSPTAQEPAEPPRTRSTRVPHPAGARGRPAGLSSIETPPVR